MKQVAFFVATLLAFIFPHWAHAEDPDLAKLFTDRHLTGTIVVSSLDGTKTYIHNDERANTRFVPASTFKIANTLIALEEGVVADGKETRKWDGKDRGVPVWNRDQSLETAFSSSCVWFYQEMARGVGLDTYASYLAGMKYGNGRVGPELTTFWLEGDLQISAVEQISFLKELYARAFPYKPSSYDLLRKLMVVEQAPAYTIRAKTGWAQRVMPQVGWFVGYVEAGGKVWFFATNLEIVKPEDSRFRQTVTMEALRLKGII